ncbi:hypothetical protein JCM30237_03790 [Halolamina litorea]|uniref:Yip1 domain-containing protein n=1 Tax=Halolamina litorea TaxID=1515593 RepID=A0ABD6BU49_9EURY|nr:hypothetical protein [Halolamina litorea]
MFRLRRTRGATAVASVLLFGLLPGTASAHALGGSRFDSPLPLPLLLLGAGATVGLTALWLGRTDRDTPPELDRELTTLPAPAVDAAKRVAAVGFLGCVLAALAAGAFGPQIAAENPATVFTWAVWFRGLAFVAIVAGTPWPVLSPWRTIAGVLAWIEGEELSVLSPPRVGAWPATVGFLLVFGVVENLTNVSLVPRLTATLLAAYALLMLSGGVLFGTSWLARSDPLAAFYRLFGAVAPLTVERRGGAYAVSLRYPWEGTLRPVAGPALVALAVAMVYVVSFDGFTDTAAFQGLLFRARNVVGLGDATATLLFLVGFAGFIGLFVVGCGLAERLGGARAGLPSATRAFAPTLLPIAAAYEIAHNYPYVLRSLGQLVAIALEPVAPGIGTVRPLSWLPLPVFWASQVLLIVAGHVVAVVAAHFVAVRRYGSLWAARRGHLPLVVLMIGYTVLSLWIVSRPVIA